MTRAGVLRPDPRTTRTLKSPNLARADVARVRLALIRLREARELLKMAGCRQTVPRVRLAITSAGGALRHAQRCEAESRRVFGGDPRERHEDDGREYGHPGDYQRGLE